MLGPEDGKGTLDGVAKRPGPAGVVDADVDPGLSAGGRLDSSPGVVVGAAGVKPRPIGCCGVFVCLGGTGGDVDDDCDDEYM